MAGGHDEMAEAVLRWQLRQEMRAMPDFVLASHVRWGIRQAHQHPGQPHYRIKLDMYAAELERRTGVVIPDGAVARRGPGGNPYPTAEG